MALLTPVAITVRDEPQVVMLNAATFRRLRDRANRRKVGPPDHDLVALFRTIDAARAEAEEV